MYNDVLKHARILNLHNQRCSFDSLQRLAEKFKPQLKFSKKILLLFIVIIIITIIKITIIIIIISLKLTFT